MVKKKKSLKQKKHELKKQDNVIPISDFLAEEEEEFDLFDTLSLMEEMEEDENHMDPIILNRIQSALSGFDFSETEEERALIYALDEKNKKKKYKLLEKFVKDYPDNFDGQFQFLLVKTEDEMTLDYLEELEKVYEMAVKEWESIDYVSYYDLMARNPLSAITYTMEVYFRIGWVGRAAEIADLVRSKIDVEERFPPGFVYLMLSIYNTLYRSDDVEEFYEETYSFEWEDDGILVHAILAQVLAGDLDLAEETMRDLVEINPSALSLFDSESWPIMLEYIDRFEFYPPNSYFSLLVALLPLKDFLEKKDFIVQQMVRLAEIVEEDIPDSPKKRGIFTRSDCMKGIQIDRVRALWDAEVRSQEDLEQHTEKEILAISGIGPKTIKQLKENGVKFREE